MVARSLTLFQGLDRWSLLRALVPLAVLFVLLGGSAAVSPGVLSPEALSGFLVDAAPLVILVVGGTLPVLAGSIDLSVAGVASLTGVLVVVLHPMFGLWTVPVVLLLAVGFGALQGFLHAWLQIPSFIVTLGTLSMLSGFSLLLSNATAQPIPDSDVIMTWLSDSSFGLSHSLFVLAAVLVLLGAAMHYLRFGRDLRALGMGERTAIMSGIDTRLVRTTIFAISSGCAALCGLFLVAITAFSSPTLAGNLLLLSIVGVVLGGTAISGGVGGLFPAVVGGLITAWLRVVTVLIGVTPTAQNIVFGLMALIAVGLTTDRKKLGIIK